MWAVISEQRFSTGDNFIIRGRLENCHYFTDMPEGTAKHPKIHRTFPRPKGIYYLTEYSNNS